VWAEKVEEKGRKGCLADVERFAMCCLWAEEVREGKQETAAEICMWDKKAEEKGRNGCLADVVIFAICCVWAEEVKERREEMAA
jgi:hypothetical protein